MRAQKVDVLVDMFKEWMDEQGIEYSEEQLLEFRKRAKKHLITYFPDILIPLTRIIKTRMTT